MPENPYYRLLANVRKWVEAVPPNVCLVGWFSATTQKTAPVSQVEVTMVYKSHTERKYPQFSSPVASPIAVNLPIATINDQFYVGGENVYYHQCDVTRRVYYREKKNGSQPAGLLYDIYTPDVRRDACLVLDTRFNPKRVQNSRRVLHQVRQLMQAHQQEEVSFHLPEKGLYMPTFFAPQARTGRLRLRRGPALDQKVQMCVATGAWAPHVPDELNELRAIERGMATYDKTNKVVTLKLHDGSATDLPFRQNVASIMMEETIEELFGVQLGVQLQPLIEKGPVPVKQYQTFFSPTPRKELSIGALHKLPQYEVLEHMAAISTMRVVNGVRMFDHSLVESDAEPYISLDEMPWTIQAVERQPVRHCQERGIPHPLIVNEGPLHVNLMDLAIRTHLRERDLAARKEREVPLSEAVQAQLQPQAGVMIEEADQPLDDE